MRHQRILVALTLATAACDRPAEISDPEIIPSSTISAPASGIASGVFIESAPLGKPGMTALDKWTKQVGKHPAYIMWYTDWSTTYGEFASSELGGNKGAWISDAATWK